VGDAVGELLGADVGDVGDDVGDTVGDDVGDAVGDVGDDVGDTVGEDVGDAVGELLGEAVGELLGAAVGELLGADVGSVGVKMNEFHLWHPAPSVQHAGTVHVSSKPSTSLAVHPSWLPHLSVSPTVSGTAIPLSEILHTRAAAVPPNGASFKSGFDL